MHCDNFEDFNELYEEEEEDEDNGDRCSSFLSPRDILRLTASDRNLESE